MIIQVDTPEYADIFAAVYNSANTLFENSEQYSELTSLYVKREFQNRRIGESLIRYFEQKMKPGTPALVKVLKNAPWALIFYQKHGFTFLDAKNTETLKALGITEKPWERILYKKF